MIRLFRDLLPSLSAFVDSSLNFTENKKLSIYWNSILHVQEKPKMYVSYQSHYDVIPSKNWLSLCSDVRINGKIRFLQIYERHEKSWNWLNWYLKQCDLLRIYFYHWLNLVLQIRVRSRKYNFCSFPLFWEEISYVGMISYQFFLHKIWNKDVFSFFVWSCTIMKSIYKNISILSRVGLRNNSTFFFFFFFC